MPHGDRSIVGPMGRVALMAWWRPAVLAHGMLVIMVAAAAGAGPDSGHASSGTRILPTPTTATTPTPTPTPTPVADASTRARTGAAAMNGLFAALAGTRVGQGVDRPGEMGASEADQDLERWADLAAEAVRLEHIGDVDAATEVLQDQLYAATTQADRDRVYSNLRRVRLTHRSAEEGGGGGGGRRRLTPLQPLNMSALGLLTTAHHWETPVLTLPLDVPPTTVLEEVADACQSAGMVGDGHCKLDRHAAPVTRIVESVCAAWSHQPAECTGTATVEATVRIDSEGGSLKPTVGAPTDRSGGVVAALLLLAPEGSTTELNARYLRLRDPRAGARVRPYPTGFEFGIPRKVELVPGTVVSFPGWVQRSLPPNPTGAPPRVYVQVAVHIPCSVYNAAPPGAEGMWGTPIYTLAPGWLDRDSTVNLLAQVTAVEGEIESVHKSNDGGFQSDVDLDRHVAAVPLLRRALYHAMGALLAQHVGAILVTDKQRCAAQDECDGGGSRDHTAANDLSPHFDANIHEIWAGISRAHQPNHPHVHPKSDLSGVVYLALPRRPGRLQFADPRGPAVECVDTAVGVTPVAGQLVLFPSWLEHWVDPHSVDPHSEVDDESGITDDSPRVVIPFNAEVTRRDPNTVGFTLRVPTSHLDNQ